MDSFFLNYTLKTEYKNLHHNKFVVVYGIICRQNNTIYVGASTIPTIRINKHRNELLQNKHINKRLQFIFNKYKKLEVVILEFITEKIDGDGLKDKEIFWIHQYQHPNSGFTCVNVAIPVNTWDSMGWTDTQRKEYKQRMNTRDYSVYRTKAHREKISNIVKGRICTWKDKLLKARNARSKQILSMYYTIQNQEGEIKQIKSWEGLKKYFKKYNNNLPYHKRISVEKLVKFKCYNGCKLLQQHYKLCESKKIVIKYQDFNYIDPILGKIETQNVENISPYQRRKKFKRDISLEII